MQLNFYMRPGASFILLIFFLISGFTYTATAVAEILPAERATVWNPGIPGGIPERTTICATINASTYNNGSSDATSGIQTAIDNCPSNQVVQLSAGTFLINGFLNLAKSIVVRGAGSSQTILSKPVGTGQPGFVVGNRYTNPTGSSINLTDNAVKGQYSVTVSSTTGLSVGRIVLIDQLRESGISYYSTDCDTTCQGWFARSGRPMGEIKEISAINDNTITFSTPFHWTYKTSLSAQLSWSNSVNETKYAGVEGLRVVNGQGGDDGGGFLVNFCAYCWLKDVETVGTSGAAFHLYYNFRTVVRDSYFHETSTPTPGGAGYGMDISSYTSDSLIENNISWYFNKVMLMRAAGGGNVIGYNYVEDGLISYDLTWPESGLNASHMATTHNVLFEGNQGFNIDADIRWGNSVYVTFLRNNSTGIRRDINNVGLTKPTSYTVGIGAWHYWYSFIGNVFGYPGISSGMTVWELGFRGPYTSPTTGTDENVAATMLREGNYTYTSSTIAWDTSPQTIPNSLYLSGKPGFFGTCTWPWVDPVGSTKLYVLPARARLDGVANPCIPPNPTITGPADLQIINTTSALLTLTTDVDATCRYAPVAGVAFASKIGMNTTGGQSHSTPLSGLENGRVYHYWVECQDAVLNTSADTRISFTVATQKKRGRH